MLYQSSQPHPTVLGKIPCHEAFGDIKERLNFSQIQSLLILRVDAPLFLVNASTLHSQIRKLVTSAQLSIIPVIIDLSVSDDLDIEVIDMLEDLLNELGENGIHLLFTDIKNTTRTRLEQTGLMDQIGEENIYLRVLEVVDDLSGTNNLSESETRNYTGSRVS